MRNLFQIYDQREIQKMKSDFYMKICLAFVVGMVIALAIGVVFAPSSGKEMREKFRSLCKKYRKRIARELYVGNINSDVFHLSSCDHLPDADNRIVYRNREEAMASGKNPCQSCNP